MKTEHGSSENLTRSLSTRRLVENHAKRVVGSNEALLEMAPLSSWARHHSYCPRTVASILRTGANIQPSREETFQLNSSVVD